MGNNISKTVISQCLEWLDIPEFVSDFLDYRTNKLTLAASIRLFVEAQLSDRQDPECIVENLRDSEELQALTGLTSLSASRFSRKLSELPTWFLQYLFEDLTRRIHTALQQTCEDRGLKKELIPLSIIDSSSITLPDYHGKWAYFSKGKNQVKLHMRLSTQWPDLAIPSKVVLSTGAVADTEVAIELVTEQGTTYVMDRGYINYAHFKKWLKAGIRFVVRVQKRSKTQILEKRVLPSEEPDLLLDADVLMAVPERPNETMRLRLVEFKDDKERTYRLITSRWDLSAREIADIYRARWDIELFFKWMKQYLRLAKLYSNKPTAVWNQIYMALIAHALCVLVKLETGTKHGLCKVLKLMRQYMAKSWEKLLDALFRKPTKTSKGRQKKRKRGPPKKHPKKYVAQKLVLENEFNQ
ncbi:IS4 family transposase [Paenibacillaceae bacterium WGS1546]|uniref:IS4 family transposase n=1 Tax=Cohnella sp. WGS1546 TaxID=3366810 RepID=UPI00372D4816